MALIPFTPRTCNSYAHNKLILSKDSKHKNWNNCCLIYCKKLNIKTQIFEFENNFCIEKYTLITGSCWLQTGLMTVEEWLQGDEYKLLDFLKKREVTKAKKEI